MGYLCTFFSVYLLANCSPAELPVVRTLMADGMLRLLIGSSLTLTRPRPGAHRPAHFPTALSPTRSTLLFTEDAEAAVDERPADCRAGTAPPPPHVALDVLLLLWWWWWWFGVLPPLVVVAERAWRRGVVVPFFFRSRVIPRHASYDTIRDAILTCASESRHESA